MSQFLHNGHVTLAQWFSLDIYNQLGNVGSEVGRAFKWKLFGNMDVATAAFFRGLELLDATITDPKNQARKRELLVARELFGDVFFEKKEKMNEFKKIN